MASQQSLTHLSRHQMLAFIVAMGAAACVAVHANVHVRAQTYSQNRTGNPEIATASRGWISRGWIDAPLTLHRPPELPYGAPEELPIDRFVRSRLYEKGIPPANLAHRRVLFERAYRDLVGTGPTEAETLLFLEDTSPMAWKKLIHRLLMDDRLIRVVPPSLMSQKTEAANRTARFSVSALWRHHLGAGLLQRNAGQSDWYTTHHRELLDYLAEKLVMADWDVRTIHREIMVSRTYRQTSRVQQKVRGLDPDNWFFGRYTERKGVVTIREHAPAATLNRSSQPSG